MRWPSWPWCPARAAPLARADDAVLDDRASGQYARAGRIRPINHVGKYYRVAGPLNMPRGPQGRPVFVQAGSSDTGRRFAARHADDVGDKGEHRQGNQQRGQARQDQNFDRVKADGFQGVHFLPQFHHADFGGKSGTGPARHHDGGHQRRHFT